VKPETHTLDDLRAMMTPDERRLADEYVKRLPTTWIISKPDFMTALNLNRETANAMIDGREVVRADWGGGSKAYWYITRESIVRLIHKRILGIRDTEPQTLRQQARLFEP
jgi:hypothetical protein